MGRKRSKRRSDGTGHARKGRGAEIDYSHIVKVSARPCKPIRISRAAFRVFEIVRRAGRTCLSFLEYDGARFARIWLCAIALVPPSDVFGCAQ